MQTRLYYLYQPVGKSGLLNAVVRTTRNVRRAHNARAGLAMFHRESDQRRRTKARKARKRLHLSRLEMAQRHRAAQRAAEARRRASGRPADVSLHYGDVDRLRASEGQRDRVRRVMIDSNAERAYRKRRMQP